MKKLLAIGIILLLVGVSIPSTGRVMDKVSTMSTEGITLFVGGSGPGNYSKIQDAIDDATDGDTVFVYNGTYYEKIRVYKSINLIGEDRDTTIIDGNHEGTVVYVHADEVLISGFTIKNCESPGNDWEFCTIKIIVSKNVIIKDNKISTGELAYNDHVASIFLHHSSYNIIQDNYIYDCGAGRSVGVEIHENSYSNNISGNEILDYVSGVQLNSNCNIVYGNNIHHNTWGILIRNYANGNEILDNIVNENSAYGIDMGMINNTVVTGNIITNNGIGWEFDCGIDTGGYNNLISYNNISNNNPTGIIIDGTNDYITNNHITNNYQIGAYSYFSNNCIISKNNFIENGNYNACFVTDFMNHSPHKWKNNYWSDFHGFFIYKIIGYVYGIFFIYPWITFDWHPAQEPYDI